jgi:hypothetical protein
LSPPNGRLSPMNLSGDLNGLSGSSISQQKI